MRGLRVVVVASPDLSDIYFANRLINGTNVVGVVVEKQHEMTPTRNRLMALVRDAKPI